MNARTNKCSVVGVSKQGLRLLIISFPLPPLPLFANLDDDNDTSIRFAIHLIVHLLLSLHATSYPRPQNGGNNPASRGGNGDDDSTTPTCAVTSGAQVARGHDGDDYG